MSLCTVFTTLILWCGVVAEQQPPSEIFYRFTDDKQLALILESALKVAEKYSSDEYIDRLINADHCKRIARQEWNEHLFTRFPLSPNCEVGIYTKDFLKGGFLATEWLIEWLVYKWCCWYATRVMFDHITAHSQDYLDMIYELDEGILHTAQLNKKIQELGPHATMLQTWQLCVDKKFIFFIITMIIGAQLISASKKSLFLVQESSFTDIFKVPQGNACKPVSAFTFVERHPILSLPLNPGRGGVTTMINMLFKSCGLLPGWVDQWYITVGTEVSFIVLFLLRMHSKQLSDGWIAWVSKSTDVLRTLLLAHQKVVSNPQALAHEREEVKRMLMRYVVQGHTVSFLDWMKYKIFCYGMWQVGVNCVLALPAWIELCKGAYQLWKAIQNDVVIDDELGVV